MSIGSAHRPLREIVADEIRDMILRGDLAPGDRLLEDRLAQQLGVSRNPVREAIRALEATGLVDVQPRQGATVSRLDIDDVSQLLVVRSVLEGLAAELAATNCSPDDLAAIDRCLEEGRAASAVGDLITAAGRHRDFHVAIEKASANDHVGSTAAPLRHRTELVFSVLSNSRSMLSWDEHQKIRDAIADGESCAARDAALAHMRSVIAELPSIFSDDDS